MADDTLPKKRVRRARGWKPVGSVDTLEPEAVAQPVAPRSRRAPLVTLLAAGGVLALAAALFYVKPWQLRRPSATPTSTPFAFVPTPTLFPKATPSPGVPAATPSPLP